MGIHNCIQCNAVLVWELLIILAPTDITKFQEMAQLFVINSSKDIIREAHDVNMFTGQMVLVEGKVRRRFNCTGLNQAVKNSRK